jgi:hypothetical protein
MTMPQTGSYRFEGIARALSAISHQGESTGGTIGVFRREKMLVDGKVIEVPIISGNSFRGLLRDQGMYYMLRALGNPDLDPRVRSNLFSSSTDSQASVRASHDETEEGITLSPPGFHFLTSGGTLTKDNGRGLDIGQGRKLRQLIPLVGVFGGSCGRQIMEGKLKVGKWYPICRELRSILPEKYRDLPEAHLSIYDMTDQHSFTRTDDAKSEHWQKFLAEAQRPLLEAPKVKAARDGTEVAEKAGTAQQMRYTQEVLIAGTKLYCWLMLQDVTDLEYEAFVSALVEWSKSPFIGGQSRHGCGEVELKFDNWLSISPLARADDQAVGMSLGHAYQQHLRQRKDEILQVLQEIV